MTSPGANITSVTQAYVFATSSITGAGGQTVSLAGQTPLVKSGTGNLVLSGTNSYHGTTYVDQGEYRRPLPNALPSSSNLNFAGGVLGLGDTDATAGTSGTTSFTRSLGISAGSVQFVGSGGFAAYGANAIVAIGGTGSTYFTLMGNRRKPRRQRRVRSRRWPAPLQRHATATGSLTFMNPINLNFGVRSIVVTAGVNSSTANPDAVMTDEHHRHRLPGERGQRRAGASWR